MTSMGTLSNWHQESAKAAPLAIAYVRPVSGQIFEQQGLKSNPCLDTKPPSP